ncbi:MAG: lysylphosphatidylglycerol synthase transmembrane domain-containing protein [Flavobacterium sp.]
MKSKIKKIISLLLPIALGVFLILYNYNQFSAAQLEQMKTSFVHADYTYIFISLGLAILALITRAYRWKYPLEHLGYETNFKLNFLAVCSSYLVNMTIPRSGEVSRALVLTKYQKIPFDKCFGTIVAERVVDFVFLLSFISLALFLQMDVLKEFLLKIIPLNTLILILVGFLIFSIGFLLFVTRSNTSLAKKIRLKTAGLVNGLKSVFQMKNKVPFLLQTLLIWLFYVLMFYVAIYALPETSDLAFQVVFTAFVVGGLAISFTNGGFGAYPVLVAEILLLYQVPLSAGTAFGWIVWISQTLLIVLLGGISFFLIPFFFNKNKT